MPTYAFVTEQGKEIDVVMSMDEFTQAQREDGTVKLPTGEVAKVDMQRQCSSCRDVHPWDSHNGSLSMGVQPEEIPKWRAYYKRRGVDVDYTRDGKPIFKSARHQHAYATNHPERFFNRDGIFS
jgi:hypothetical protein